MSRCQLIVCLVLTALAQPCCHAIFKRRGLIVNKDTFMKQCLERHNQYRKWHNAKPLTYSDELNIFAQYYADYLAKKDNPTLIHSRTPYGENLYYYVGPVDGYKAVDVWYIEHKLYNFNLPDPPNYVQVGHFTQLVWNTTVHLGAGAATSKSGRTYVVCSYYPRGNDKSKYNLHVFPATKWF